MKWEDEALLQLFGCVGCGEVEVEDDEDYSQRCISCVDEVFGADIVRATCFTSLEIRDCLLQIPGGYGGCIPWLSVGIFFSF